MQLISFVSLPIRIRTQSKTKYKQCSDFLTITIQQQHLFMNLILIFLQQFDNLMWKQLLLFSLVIMMQTESITAEFKLIQYSPYLFQLRFSEIIERPKFQLILNNVHRINYTIITNTKASDSFYFQTPSTSSIPNEMIQKYQLIFNYPLQVGSGRLGQKYYKLIAEKAIVQIPYSQIWGLLAIIASYIAVNLSTFGILMFQFLEIYSLMMLRNSIKTQLYHEIGKDLLILNPDIIDGTYTYDGTIYTPICGPFTVILVFGALSYTVKRLIKYPKTIIMKIIYDYIVYDLFVYVSLAFILPLFYNSIQFIVLFSSGIIQNGTKLAYVGFIFSYFGLITTVAIIYLMVYKINPKLGQDNQSWSKQIKGNNFNYFGKLHSHIRLQNWYSRNYSLTLVFKRLLVGCLYFTPHSFEISVFFIQFCNIYYVFTIRPYKNEINTNICIICRLLMFLYYGLVVVGNLYFSLLDATASYPSFQYYLNTRQLVFLLICLLIFSVMFYQVYSKCSNLNYHIKVVKEQNAFKIKIIENKNAEEESNEEQEEKKKNFTELQEIQLKQFLSKKKKDSIVSEETPKLKRQSLIKSDQHKKRSIEKIKSMDNEEKMIKRQKSFVSKNKIKKDHPKWKKQSLLVEIMKKV